MTLQIRASFAFDQTCIRSMFIHQPKFQMLSPRSYHNINVFKFRELLTPQQHYDWGLRALKTVLRGCGSLLHQLKKSDAKQESKIDHIKLLILQDLVKVLFTPAFLFTGILKIEFFYRLYLQAVQKRRKYESPPSLGDHERFVIFQIELLYDDKNTDYRTSFRNHLKRLSKTCFHLPQDRKVSLMLSVFISYQTILTLFEFCKNCHMALHSDWQSEMHIRIGRSDRNMLDQTESLHLKNVF